MQRQEDFDNVSASNANFQLSALSRVKNKMTFPGTHEEGVNVLIGASVHCSYHKRRLWNWLDGRTGSRREQSQSLRCWADRGKLKTVVNVHRKTNVTANRWGFLAMQLVKKHRVRICPMTCRADSRTAAPHERFIQVLYRLNPSLIWERMKMLLRVMTSDASDTETSSYGDEASGVFGTLYCQCRYAR